MSNTLTKAEEALDIWENFKPLPDKKIISPLWSMEFGATYPFENTTPFALGKKKKYKVLVKFI